MTKTNPTIIIADDEESIRETYQIAFTSKGFTVLMANDGLEIFEWLETKNGKVDIILSDIVMPKMDGFEFLERIKKDELYKQIPVVVSSNLESETDKKAALELGAVDYLEKVKWTPSKLAEKVKELCCNEDKPAPKKAKKV